MTDHSDLIAELRAASDWHAESGAGALLSCAASALSSQSLSLSEARAENDRKDAEIERLKGLVAGIRECPQEPSSVEAVARAIHQNAIMALPDEVWGLLNKLPPTGLSRVFSRLAEDAHTKSPDPSLSSLRKGAEVAVKPLEWREINPSCDLADTPFGSVRVYRDGTWYGQWSKEGDEQSADFEAAKSAAQSDFETRIRSALVSGSREDRA